MGCGESKQVMDAPAPKNDPPTVSTAEFDKYQLFENSFDFQKTWVQEFESCVKRFVVGKNSVSLKQLQYSFKDVKGWEDLNSDSSLLCRILRDPIFVDADNAEEISL